MVKEALKENDGSTKHLKMKTFLSRRCIDKILSLKTLLSDHKISKINDFTAVEVFENIYITNFEKKKKEYRIHLYLEESVFKKICKVITFTLGMEIASEIMCDKSKFQEQKYPDEFLERREVPMKVNLGGINWYFIEPDWF